jgi:hypothetical protein
VVGQITEASREQNIGLEQINRALNLMSQVTQTNAAGSEETASASEELTHQSVELRAGVDVLVKLVTGRSFSDTEPTLYSQVSPAPGKSVRPPVQSMKLDPRKKRPASSLSGNGNGNGNGHHAKNHDDSFFDM